MFRIVCLLWSLVILHFSTSIQAQWAPIIELSSTDQTNTAQNENMGQSIVAIQNFIHVVWFNTISTSDSAIYYKRSTDGGSTWDNETRLSPPNVLDGDPLIAACGTYLHVAYWRNPYNTLYGNSTPPTTIYYKRSTDSGATWKTEVSFGHYAYWPGIACSENYVYINNNNITSNTPYNTEVFFQLSSDNGSTWSNITQISNSVGRSEDPAMSAYGSNVYMAWNDNRLDQKHLQLYFRASNDYGQTWGPETSLSALPDICYSPTVFADGDNAHIFYADTAATPYFVKYVKSADGGKTFTTAIPITNNATWYESVAADQENIHVVCGCPNCDHNYYITSSDGGVTWSNAELIATWSSSAKFTRASFISVLDSVVYLAWSMVNTSGNNGIFYTYNPTANLHSVPSSSPPSNNPSSPVVSSPSSTPSNNPSSGPSPSGSSPSSTPSNNPSPSGSSPSSTPSNNPSSGPSSPSGPPSGVPSKFSTWQLVISFTMSFVFIFVLI